MTAVDSTETEAWVELEAVTAASLENPDQPSVEGVDWRIGPRQWWVIGGWAGGGKSGLLATAAGLLRPLQGRQRLFGRELGGQQGDALAAERRQLGIVFGEGGRVFRPLTVAQNVALPYCYHQDCAEAEAEAAVAEVLEALGLTFVARVPASRLNPSWRLRTALARALILRPRVLFLDDPLQGLDARHRAWWLECLNGLATGHPLCGGEPLTLVVATEDLRPWLKDGRRFALLKQHRWAPLGVYREGEGFNDPLWRELGAETMVNR